MQLCTCSDANVMSCMCKSVQFWREREGESRERERERERKL